MFGGCFISFLDNQLVSSIIFYPRKEKVPIDLDSSIRALEFQIDEGISIGGLCFLKDPNLPTILMFHGNGEISFDYFNFYPSFHEIGVNLAVIDYRGYGFSSGEPFFTSLITDAMPIYDNFRLWMIEEGLKNSLFVMGRSLGSVCASEIGAKDPPDLRGIFFESGFASLYNMMTRLFGISGPEITPENLAKWSNDTRMAQIRKPVLIIHGSHDFIIPSSQAQLIQEALPEDIETKLIIIRGAGHNDILLHEDIYFPPLKEFIETHE